MRTTHKIATNNYCALVFLHTLSCSVDHSAQVNCAHSDIASAKAIITSEGDWRVASYTDGSKDRTSGYTEYAFTFFSDGSLTAVNGSATIRGSWSISIDSDNNSGDGHSDIDFRLDINKDEEDGVGELADDWDLVSITPSTLTLTDITSGNGGINNLIFSKN